MPTFKKFTNVLPRLTLPFLVYMGLAPPPAEAAQMRGGLIGLYGPAVSTDGVGGPIFEIVQEHGKLAAYVIPDDDVNGDGSCGRAVVLNTDGTVARPRRLSFAASSAWLKQPAPSGVNAIGIGDWGAVFHAHSKSPKGRRGSARTGFFAVFATGTSAMPQPLNLEKLDVTSVCPRGGPR